MNTRADYVTTLAILERSLADLKTIKNLDMTKLIRALAHKIQLINKLLPYTSDDIGGNR